jgi:predicted DNA-binding protein
VICTDCYSNLVIFNEFKKICRNADDLLRKYQINKTDSQDIENAAGTSNNTKGNGKCKSIRNSDDMAQRIRETAYKKSMTFVENMKSFYFLLNQIEDLENGGAQVIIKNEISTESLIPAVELNIKNEIIYPNEENQMVVQHGVIQQNPESSGESKRKKRKNNKRKSVNGQTMEIDETGTIVATRQIVITTDSQQQQQHHHLQQHQHHPHQNIQISTQNNNEMALMLTVKSIDQEHAHVVATSTGHSQTIQPAQIQIHSSKFFT